MQFNEILSSNSDIKDVKRTKEYISEFKRIKKNFSKFINIRNPYHKTEFERQLNSILDASFDEKNTLVLSNTNYLISAIRKYLKTPSGASERKIKIIENTNDFVLEYKPFDNGVTLRIILFNAEADREVDIKEYTKLYDVSMKIVFISSYASAGTGLNYFSNYICEKTGANIEEDFERLVLVNMPHYTEIKDSSGLNSIDNFILLLKYYSKLSNTTKKLKDFDTNLINSENYEILMDEHNLSIFKTILQAIGRIERKDTRLNSEIYLPEELISLCTMQFILLSNKENETMINSMSLLNTEFMKYCYNRSKRHMFNSNEERLEFENEVESNGELVKTFIGKLIMKEELDKFRNGKITDISINEALRDINLVINPEQAIEDLKKNAFVVDNEYEDIIDLFYIDTYSEKLIDIEICKTKSSNRKLTDIKKGCSRYTPYEQIIPSYNGMVFRNTNSIAYRVLNKYVGINHSQRYIPNPYLIPLLIGNMGEAIFKDVLIEKEVDYLSVEEIRNELSPVLYELFDYYIVKDGELICIDVKNWSTKVDKKDASLKTISWADKKISTIKKLVGTKFENIHFLYVNTKIEENELNVRSEKNKDNIYFLNLFKATDEYKHKNEGKITITSKIILNDILDGLISGR